MRRDELLESFKRYLAEGEIGVGDILPGEVELAKLFGVSRTAIREVIIHLTFLGVLGRRTRRGTVVKVPDAAEIGGTLAFQVKLAGYGFEELKEARLLLETSQAELLARRATPQTLERLSSLVDDMAAAVERPLAADALDMSFHIALMEVVGNRLLMIFTQVLKLLFDQKYRGKYLNAAAARRSVGDHRKMLQAIRAGDVRRFEEIVREHIERL